MYKTYIISLITNGHGDHQISAQMMLPRTMNFCNQYNWNAEIFHAINGYNLQNSAWEIHGLIPPGTSNRGKGKFGNLPGAQGCFFSHYLLWNRCIELDHPIFILEDDADVIGPIPIMGNSTLDLVKLHAPRRPNKKLGIYGVTAPGAFAYWVSPTGAKKLINFSKINGPGLTDKLIGSFVLNWDYLDNPVVRLGPRIGSSTQPNKYPYRNLYK